MDDALVKKVEAVLRYFADFPKKGVNFCDVFSLTKEPLVLQETIEFFAQHIEENASKVDVIVGLEARGFIFGPLIAAQLKKPFVPIRKKGKLPGETVRVSYSLEYGEDIIEVQADAITKGQKVVIVDDLLATGGTMSAACQLMQKLQAEVLECLLLVELDFLEGRKKISAPVFSLIHNLK